MKLRSFLLLTLLAISASSFADEPPAGAPPAGMPHGGEAPIMFRAGGIGTIGIIGYDLPTIGVAYLPVDHVMVAAALSLHYNGTGDGVMQGPASSRFFVPAQTWESGLLVAVEYMIKDAMPFAMGPALAVRTNFTPVPTSLAAPLVTTGAFTQWIIMPAWDLWYTPWNAPLALGASIGMAITLQSGRNVDISVMTPALRAAYTF